MQRTVLAASFSLLLLAPVTAAQNEERMPRVPLRPLRLSESELSIWKDPSFQRYFVESFRAETDIEPKLTINELADMEKVQEHLADDEIEDAWDLVAKNDSPASSAIFDVTAAKLYLQAEQREEARSALRVAVRKFPKFRRAWQQLGWMYVQDQEWGDAVEALTKVVQLGGNDAFTFSTLAYTYFQLGNYVSAETAYRMALLLDPSATDSEMGLAQSLYRQGRFADAAAVFGKMIGDQPENAKLWLAQANAYVRQGLADRAALNLEFVDQLGKSTTGSLYLLGNIYVNERLYELARDGYVRAALRQEPGDAGRAIAAADTLARRAALEATGALLDAIEEHHGEALTTSDKKEILKLRARVALASGGGDEEARVLREITALDPLDGDAFLLLGDHSWRAGDLEQAAFYYERSANVEGFEASAKLRYAELLVSQRRYTEALGFLRRAYDLDRTEAVGSFLEKVERAERATQGRSQP